jgi:hypothetical protein
MLASLFGEVQQTEEVANNQPISLPARGLVDGSSSSQCEASLSNTRTAAGSHLPYVSCRARRVLEGDCKDIFSTKTQHM